jgi:exonuclease VII small subunit
MEGFKLGVYAFAHWKDGEQLVGTTGRKLKDVLKEVDALILKEKEKNG